MNIPIRVYYHVTMINDYLDITKYIFDKIVDSGLSADMEGCYIGALGDASELPKLKELISQYPKTEIRSWDEEKGLWEFATIRHLKHDADALPKHYQMYLHSKSCTYPPQGDGKEKKPEHKKSEWYWMSYMTHSIVTRWRTGYKMLSLPDYGYDIVGCRMIPRRHSASLWTHASGNFVFLNSEYVKTLPSISSDDSVVDIQHRIEELERELIELKNKGSYKILGNIFAPEQYWWTHQPLTYISCNAFCVGFPTSKTFEQTIEGGYPIHEYQTNAL